MSAPYRLPLLRTRNRYRFSVSRLFFHIDFFIPRYVGTPVKKTSQPWVAPSYAEAGYFDDEPDNDTCRL